jgi:OOP family OmpA-OmpF porin
VGGENAEGRCNPCNHWNDDWKTWNGDWKTWNGDWKNWSLGVDALYFFSRDGFQPFVLVGVGGIRDEVWNRNPGSLMGDAGAGFLYPIGERALFRTDLRYRWDDNSDSLRNQGNFSDGIVTVGLQIPLGAKPRHEVAVAPPPPPRPAPRPAPPPPPVRHIELSADALFAFDKATLMPRGMEDLDKLVRDLGEVSYDTIVVVGHTDPLGPDAYNQRLSQSRAATVANYLTRHGVHANTVRAEGRGEAELKVTPADCSSARGRTALIACYQPNRRVEVNVTGVVQP